MTGNDYQRAALRSCEATLQSDKMLNGALGLGSKAGEIADLVKENKLHIHKLDKKELIEDLGDICWHITILADGLNVDLDTILDMNVQKPR